MTAINAFHSTDVRFVYLACDGASFDYADGAVAVLGGKISTFPEYKIAWAMSGPNLAGAIVHHVTSQIILDQSDVLRYMREAFIDCRKGMAIGKPEGEKTGVNDLTLIAALYLESEARPAIYRLASNPAAMPDCPVNKWHEIEGTLQPSRIPHYIESRGAYVDEPVHDCRELFRAQRHHDFEGMHGAPGVGGTCSLYRVGPDGIEAWDILVFADKVGSVADIADNGVDVLSPVSSVRQ